MENFYSPKKQAKKSPKYLLYELMYFKKKIKGQLAMKMKKQLSEHRKIIEKLLQLQWRKMQAIQKKQRQYKKYQKDNGQDNEKNEQDLQRWVENISRLKNSNEVMKQKILHKKKMIDEGRKYLSQQKQKRQTNQSRIKQINQRFQQLRRKKQKNQENREQIMKYQLEGTQLKDVLLEKITKVNNIRARKEKNAKKLSQILIKIESIRQKIRNQSPMSILKSELEQKIQEKQQLQSKMRKVLYETCRQQGKKYQQTQKSAQLQTKRSIMMQRLQKAQHKRTKLQAILSNRRQRKDNYEQGKMRINEELKKYKIWAMIEIEHAQKVLGEYHKQSKQYYEQLAL